MKQIIISTFFILYIVIPAISQTYSTYKIIDIKKIHPYEIIATATDFLKPHRTVQFKATDIKWASVLQIDSCVRMNYNGEYMAPCRSTSPYISPNNDTLPNTKVWKIVKPSLIKASTVTDLLYVDYTHIFIAVKRDSSGYTGFYIPRNNELHLNFGQTIFQNTFNNKKFAIAMPYNQDEIKNNLFYSFPLEFLSRQSYDSMQKKLMDNAQNTLNNSGSNPTGINPAPGTNYVIQTNQWEINPNYDHSSSNIGLDCQANAEFNFNIYPASSDSLIFSSASIFTYATFQIDPVEAPKIVDVKISGMSIKNIPIYRGEKTRIKAGALNITTSSPWTLYDSSKINTVYTSTVPKKVEFPVGIYQLEMNGTAQQIEIKDGQTLQLGDSTSAPQTQKLNKGYQPWEIKPDPTIKGIGGEIVMQIPKFDGFNTNLEFFNAGEKTNRQASWFGNNKAKLLPGMYDVVIDDRDTIKNVPVELSKQTRLKMGVFYMGGYSDANLENSVTHQKFTYGAPFKILLPEGTYYLNKNKKVPIVIKDGELTEL